MADNAITVIGNLTHDPELRHSADGKTSRCKFQLAAERRWFDTEFGEWKRDVSFVSAVAFSPLANNLVVSVKKGDRLIATGKLVQHAWKGPDGEERSQVEIMVDDVGVALRWATVVGAERTVPHTAGPESDKSAWEAPF